MSAEMFSSMEQKIILADSNLKLPVGRIVQKADRMEKNLISRTQNRMIAP